jgi:hypothetical protein
MSKISITPNASGTGVFTISSPATNTDRTLTLPDEAGTVLTSASSLASANLTGTVTVSGSNVGIGTATPTGILNVKGTGGDAMPATSGSTQSAGLVTRLQQGGGIGSVMDIGGNGGGGSWIQVTEAGDLATNYKLLLNPNGGNVGIGTTSPSFEGGSGTGLEINNSSGLGAHVKLTDSSSGSGGTNGFDLYAFNTNGYIENYEAGSIVVRNGGTERMKIDSSGTLFVNALYNNTTAGGANVYVSGVGSLYRSTSSLRYKNTVTAATHGLTELMSLRPVTYKGNNDGDTVFGGLIAEEVHDAGLTEFVTYNDEGQPDALAYSNMVSLCIKAIQEQQVTIMAQQTKIDAMEIRLAALEAV